MARTTDSDRIIVKKSELKQMLREVVREELERFAESAKGWEIEEGSMLEQDLIELKKEIRKGRLQLYASKEDLKE